MSKMTKDEESKAHMLLRPMLDELVRKHGIKEANRILRAIAAKMGKDPITVYRVKAS